MVLGIFVYDARSFPARDDQFRLWKSVVQLG